VFTSTSRLVWTEPAPHEPSRGALGTTDGQHDQPQIRNEHSHMCIGAVEDARARRALKGVVNSAASLALGQVEAGSSAGHVAFESLRVAVFAIPALALVCCRGAVVRRV
jgi:hypothetical protein